MPSLALPAPDRHTVATLPRSASWPRRACSSNGLVAGFRPRRRERAGRHRSVPAARTACPLRWSWPRGEDRRVEPAEIVQRLGDALSTLGGGPNGITPAADAAWHVGVEPRPAHRAGSRCCFAGCRYSPADSPSSRWRRSARPAPQPTELLDLLAKLVDKSLVVARETAGPPLPATGDGAAIGTENLDHAGETLQLQAAHCAYFLDFAVAHNPERATGVVIEQPKLVDGEHDNLRAALRWSIAHDPETALRLTASLWRFGTSAGHRRRGRAVGGAGPGGGTGADQTARGRADRAHRSGFPAGAQQSSSGAWRGGDDDHAADRRAGRGGDDPDHRGHAGLEHLRPGRRRTSCHRRARRALERGRPEHAAAGSWPLGQCALFREDGPVAARRLETLPERAGAVRPRPPAVLSGGHAGRAFVPIAGWLVPYLEETMLLGRRVGVIQATGYARAAIGYANRLTGDHESAMLGGFRRGRAVHRVG